MSKRKMGARGKYREWITKEGLLKIEGWARDGLTDEQIAKNIGIARTTLYEWQNKYPDIRDALKKGKEVVDREVENALLKSALGFEYEEKEVLVTVGEDGTEQQRVKKTTKHMKPDSTAQIFWLKNRKPTEWRDRKDIDVKGAIDIKDNRKYIEKYLENK